MRTHAEVDEQNAIYTQCVCTPYQPQEEAIFHLSMHRSGWHHLLLPFVQGLQTVDCPRFSARTVKSLTLAIFALLESAVKLPATEIAFKVFIMRTKA